MAQSSRTFVDALLLAMIVTGVCIFVNIAVEIGGVEPETWMVKGPGFMGSQSPSYVTVYRATGTGFWADWFNGWNVYFAYNSTPPAPSASMLLGDLAVIITFLLIAVPAAVALARRR